MSSIIAGMIVAIILNILVERNRNNVNVTFINVQECVTENKISHC